MGLDDGVPTKHVLSEAVQQTDAIVTPTLKLREADITKNLVFTGAALGQESAVLMTLTQDGKLIPGPGLTSELATQKLAGMLVEKYAEAIDARIIALKEELSRAYKTLNSRL